MNTRTQVGIFDIPIVFLLSSWGSLLEVLNPFPLVHVCMHACMCVVWTYTHLHTCVHTYIQAYMQATSKQRRLYLRRGRRRLHPGRGAIKRVAIRQQEEVEQPKKGRRPRTGFREGSSTQSRDSGPKNHEGYGFGTRVLNYWVLLGTVGAAAWAAEPHRQGCDLSVFI